MPAAYQEPNYAIGRRAGVLGAKMGSGNIGEAIVNRLLRIGFDVYADDCDRGGYFDAPEVEDMIGWDDLVVTLGLARSQEFCTYDERTLAEVIHANLTLPLLAIRRYIDARMRILVNLPPDSEDIAHTRVVVIGSYAHDHVLSNSTPYCAAKAGLAHAVRSLAWDLTPSGFRFYAVHPYHVPSTPMGGQVLDQMVKSGLDRSYAREYQRKDLRMPDHLEPAEVAETAEALLTNPVAGWLSGQQINLYGGTR